MVEPQLHPTGQEERASAGGGAPREGARGGHRRHRQPPLAVGPPAQGADGVEDGEAARGLQHLGQQGEVT